MRTILAVIILVTLAAGVAADPTAAEVQTALEGRTYMHIRDGGESLAVTFSLDGTLIQERLRIIPRDGELTTVVEGVKEKSYVLANTLRLDAVHLFIFGTLEGESGAEVFYEHYRLTVGNDGWDTIYLQDLREGVENPGPVVPYRRFE